MGVIGMEDEDGVDGTVSRSGPFRLVDEGGENNVYLLWVVVIVVVFCE